MPPLKATAFRFPQLPEPAPVDVEEVDVPLDPLSGGEVPLGKLVPVDVAAVLSNDVELPLAPLPGGLEVPLVRSPEPPFWLLFKEDAPVCPLRLFLTQAADTVRAKTRLTSIDRIMTVKIKY